jgi:apolipoprotein N-acyltransferase
MKILLTIVLGVLFTLCFAPHYQLEFGFICLTGLLLVLDSVKTSKKVFLYGWLFGFVHHVSGLYWISYSMLVEPDKFAWMIPFSATAIPAILALVIGLTCWMTYKLNLKIISKMLFFAAAWALTEMVRGNLFTGFPWNLTGYVFLTKITIAQTASYIGVYGLSLIAIVLFCSPHFAVRYIRNSTHAPIYKYCLSLYYIIPIIILLMQLSEWGQQ